LTTDFSFLDLTDFASGHTAIIVHLLVLKIAQILDIRDLRDLCVQKVEEETTENWNARIFRQGVQYYLKRYNKFKDDKMEFVICMAVLDHEQELRTHAKFMKLLNGESDFSKTLRVLRMN
jgi:hypothetical protein